MTAARPQRAGALAANWLRQAAVAITVTVTVIMIVPLWGIAHNPSLLYRSWAPWGWFIVLPYAVAVFLLIVARWLRNKAAAPEAP